MATKGVRSIEDMLAELDEAIASGAVTKEQAKHVRDSLKPIAGVREAAAPRVRTEETVVARQSRHLNINLAFRMTALAMERIAVGVSPERAFQDVAALYEGKTYSHYVNWVNAGMPDKDNLGAINWLRTALGKPARTRKPRKAKDIEPSLDGATA